MVTVPDGLYAMPGNEALTESLCGLLGSRRGQYQLRRFPDEETYLRIEDDCKGRAVAVVCSLDRPDAKTLQVLFMAATLRELGATQVGLITPYLAYMRQDKRFHPGEAISSRPYAGLLSAHFDWLVTVDPHLHRYASLADLYAIPARVTHAAPVIADWITGNVDNPVLVGPDEESGQWVADVASHRQLPYVVLQKVRRGDRDVSVSLPKIERWRDHTPVLVDDIISSGRTLIETLGHLRRLALPLPVCIGVHAVFAEGAYGDLLAARPHAVVTCNTIAHESNRIDVAQLLAASIQASI